MFHRQGHAYCWRANGAKKVDDLFDSSIRVVLANRPSIGDARNADVEMADVLNLSKLLQGSGFEDWVECHRRICQSAEVTGERCRRHAKVVPLQYKHLIRGEEAEGGFFA